MTPFREIVLATVLGWIALGLQSAVIAYGGLDGATLAMFVILPVFWLSMTVIILVAEKKRLGVRKEKSRRVIPYVVVMMLTFLCVKEALIRDIPFPMTVTVYAIAFVLVAVAVYRLIAVARANGVD